MVITVLRNAGDMLINVKMIRDLDCSKLVITRKAKYNVIMF